MIIADNSYFSGDVGADWGIFKAEYDPIIKTLKLIHKDCCDDDDDLFNIPSYTKIFNNSKNYYKFTLF